MKCNGVLYVSSSPRDEHDMNTLEVWAECDSIDGCGFRLLVDDDARTWGITNEEMTDLQISHIVHSREVAARDAV